MDKMTWTKRAATVQAGEYAESNTRVTEHVSADGRFSILPSGGMRYSREFGLYGSLVNRWVWTGYRLTDTTGRLRQFSRFRTVGAAKRAAEKHATIEAQTNLINAGLRRVEETK